MNVLLITHYPSLYGANLSMLTLIRELMKKGMKITVLVPGLGLLTEALENENIKYQVIDVYPSVWIFSFKEFLKLPYKLFRFFKSVIVINNYVKAQKPDLIYSNGSVLVNGNLVALLNNINHVWHLREYGKLDYNLTHFMPKFVYAYFLRKSTVNICISQSIMNYYLEKSPQANFKLVYNGVFEKRVSSTFLDKGVSNFLILGYISPEKNQLEAIKAFAEVLKIKPLAKLDVIGSGAEDYFELLKESIRDLKLEKSVRFLGYVKKDEIEFDRYDIFLLCSKNEAFGRVIVEAMENGLVVFAHNSGGVPEIVKHNENGFLYSSGYLNLAELIIEKIEKSDLDIIRSNALHDIDKHFSIRSYGNIILDIILNLE